jgi:hypothetical protein
MGSSQTRPQVLLAASAGSHYPTLLMLSELPLTLLLLLLLHLVLLLVLIVLLELI